MGSAMGFSGVWVWVEIFVPPQNPYPSHGYGGLVVGWWWVFGCGDDSTMRYVKDSDVLNAAVLPDVESEEEDLAEDWDAM
jgi:hypothetical protein